MFGSYVVVLLVEQSSICCQKERFLTKARAFKGHIVTLAIWKFNPDLKSTSFKLCMIDSFLIKIFFKCLPLSFRSLNLSINRDVLKSLNQVKC